MNLNSLPPECLQHILSFLPLRDLLRSHQVCQLWASLQRSECANRRQVTIIIGNRGYTLLFESPFRMPYKDILDPSTPVDLEPRLKYNAQNAKDNFDLLQFDWLDSLTCDELVSLLPNVTELKVEAFYVKSEFVFGELDWGRKSVLMDQIISLLTRWRSTLDALTLSIRFSNEKHRQIYQDYWKLFRAINQLDSLRRLTIELHNNKNRGCIEPVSIGNIEQFQFPVFSHLEQLSFLVYGKSYLEAMLGSLNMYGGPESNLKRISLSNVYHFETILYNNQMRHWMRNVVHFPELTICDFDRRASFILDRFPRLERITISADSLVKFPQKLKYLESLLNLTHLVMSLKNSNSKYSKNDDMNDDEWDEIDRPPVSIVDPCLPSVRVLVINAWDLNHEDLHPFSWPSILPNLEILHYNDSHLNCKICNIKPTKYDCSEKALSPWTRCARIRRIYSGDLHNPQRWNLSELR